MVGGRSAGGGPRWPALIREGTTSGATIAAPALSCGVRAPCQVAVQRPDATRPLCQGGLGMAVGCIEGRGGFTPGMAMTPWGRHVRQGLGHGSPEGGWAVRDDADSGPLERLLHLASEG